MFLFVHVVIADMCMCVVLHSKILHEHTFSK